MPDDQITPPKTVEVNKDALDNILKTIEQLKKDNAMLKAVADVGRVARYESQNGTPQPKSVKVSRFDNGKGEWKYVLASKLISNEVYQDPITHAYHEKQDVELIFEDDTKHVVPNKAFAINSVKVDAEIQSATTDQLGHTTYVVMITGDKDTVGQKLTIDSRFVN